MQQHHKALLSAVFFALVAAAATAALGLVGGIAMYTADSGENDMAGFGVPQLGLFAAPFVGVVVGRITYSVVMSRQ